MRSGGSGSVNSNKTNNLARMRQESNQRSFISNQNGNSIGMSPRVDITTINDARGQMVAERIVVRNPNNSRSAITYGESKLDDQTSTIDSSNNRNRPTPSSSMINSNTATGARRPKMSFDQPLASRPSRGGNSDKYLQGPIDPQGSQLSLSDRPITCSSSNNRNEIVFGCADHSCYAIDLANAAIEPLNSRKRIKQMHSKTYGHRDWVTSTAHLLDGRVLSGGMDGQLCLWDHERQTCLYLTDGRKVSIAKVVADSSHPTAISSGYDGNLAVWSLSQETIYSSIGDSSSLQSMGRGVNASSRGVTRGPRSGGSSGLQPDSSAMQSLTICPHSILRSEVDSPNIECCYRDNLVAAGNKAGQIHIWDVKSQKLMTRLRAHPGAVTVLMLPLLEDSNANNNIIVSGGNDGMIKVWDLRIREGSSVVFKANVHEPQRLPPNASNNPNAPILSSITCASLVSNRGSLETSYIISGGFDGAVACVDMRSNYDVVYRNQVHRAPIHCLKAVGDNCLFTGDGSGKMHCSHLMQGNVMYGIGVTMAGAVKTIDVLDGKVITGSDDGNVLVFEYM